MQNFKAKQHHPNALHVVISTGQLFSAGKTLFYVTSAK
jgi:hypothetical protein